MTELREDKAGISIRMPLNLVAFDHYDPPFAHFKPRTDAGVRVLLISQTGNRATLGGLYDIMQTLEIVPLGGAREKRKNSFMLTGHNDRLASYTYARLQDGMIKGFTLIWPPAMDAVMQKVAGIMRASLHSTGRQTLDDVPAAPEAGQDIDLMAGLELRKPRLSRSGFYIDAAGAVLTSLDAVRQCRRLTIDNDYEANVAFTDPALGIAVLRPRTRLAPMSHAAFNDTQPRLRSEVAVAGYSYGGRLGAPTLTYGTLADLRGLDGETSQRRLALTALPGDAGGPVLDQGGAVVGLLIPRDKNPDRRLPDDVRFAAAAGPIAKALDDSGFGVEISDQPASMAPEDLARMAGDITVLVSCWN